MPGVEARREGRWPLRVVACPSCWLVQLGGESPEEPAVPGPAPWTTSDSLERQARDLVRVATALLGDKVDAHIVETASHGNFLQPLFGPDRSVTIIERSEILAAYAITAGFRVLDGDLATPASLAERLGPVDLFVDHYALAHHPQPDLAVAGIADMLAPNGWAVFEFDSLLPSLKLGEWDGFRHGHFSYLSLLSLSGLLARHGLAAVEVTSHPVYGGVLRVTARRADRVWRPSDSVEAALADERAAGLDEAEGYARIGVSVDGTCSALRKLIDAEREAGGRVAGYGAPSRGNTLLNACAIGPDRLAFTVDRSNWKQGRVLPGSHVPIQAPETLAAGISLVVILTWDIADDVAATLGHLPESVGLAVPFPIVGRMPARPRGGRVARP
jgi:hypothetical protein